MSATAAPHNAIAERVLGSDFPVGQAVVHMQALQAEGVLLSE